MKKCALIIILFLCTTVFAVQIENVNVNPVRGATFVIAASDASGTSKTQADYVCDGTADEEEIQAAIDKLLGLDATFRGTIALSRGNFYISTPIDVNGGITIEGQGIYGTNVQLADNANCDMFVYDNNNISYFFTLRDMILNGNKANNTSGRGIVLGENLYDVFLQNLFISSFSGDGIYSKQGWGWIIDNVVIEFCEGNGAYFISPDPAGSVGVTGPKIKGCKFITNDGHGLLLGVFVFGSLITNSEFAGGTGKYGIKLEGAYLSSITNCRFLFNENTSQGGIGLRSDPNDVYKDSLYNTISNNIFKLTTAPASMIGNTVQGSDWVHITTGFSSIGTGSILGFSTGMAHSTYNYVVVDINDPDPNIQIVRMLTGADGAADSNQTGVTITHRRRGVQLGMPPPAGGEGSAYYSVVSNNIFNFSQSGDRLITNPHGQSNIHSNYGFVTEVSEIISVTGNGSDTTITLNHDLATKDVPGYCDRVFTITPSSQPMAEADYWISSISTSQVVITFSSALLDANDYDFHIRGFYQNWADNLSVP